MILELAQVIWLDTPKGKGIAKFVIDYGPGADLMWVVFIEASREIWTFPNWRVKASENSSMESARADRA